MDTIINNEQRELLIKTALDVRRWAYAPYSNYAVGAALLTASGKIYDGVNVENAAYPNGICAERTAVFKAVSEGEHHFIAICIASPNGGAPCGACRQVLAEFGLNTLVMVINAQGEITLESILADLLPRAFVPKSLI
jgi:cytidine deaminase